MRISDWSSDVCSSDLTTGRPAYSQFDVAMTGDGRFVITWIDRINILGISALKQQTLDAQRYASDGSPIGSVITVYQTDLFAVRTPTVAVDGAGNLDRKSTRLNSITNAHLVCRLLLETKNKTQKNNEEYKN